MTFIIKKNLNKKLLFCIILLLFFILIAPIHTFAIDSVAKVLSDHSNNAYKSTRTVWEILINSANSFIILVLIVIAFAQILRLNVNTYGIKKILPALIMAIIAANFSFLFCRLLVDSSNIIMNVFLEGGNTSAIGLTDGLNVGGNAADFDVMSGGGTLWFLTAQLLRMAGAVAMLVLAFLLYIRNWMIYFLVALAPLAFMATVLPATKSVFNQWISNFAKWVFLPVVSIFWMWIGTQWFTSVVDNTGNAGIFMGYVFTVTCFYLAITTPFKMGGAIMSGWANLAKKPGGWAWGKAKEKWVDPAIKEVKDNAMSWYRSQGSGHKYNPVGMLVRRGARVEDRRNVAAELSENWKSTLHREAHGGKDGQYLNKKAQEKIAARKAFSRSLLGEKEWMEEHLESIHYQTEAGKEDLDSQTQFYFRTQGTKIEVEGKKAQAKSDVFEDREGKGDFFKNPNYVYWYKKWTEKTANFRPSIAAARKGEADILSDTFLDAAKLNLALLGFKASKKALLELEKILEDPDSFSDEEKVKLAKRYQVKDISNLTKREKRNINKRYRTVKEGNDLAESDFNLQNAQLLRKYAELDAAGNVIKFRGMSDTLEKMWKDEHGNFTTNIDRVREMADINGVSETSKDMWNDRLGKGLAEDHNEELKATQGKRSSLQSEIYLQTEMPDDYELHLQGRDGALIGSRSKKVYAEVNHSTKTAPQNPETATDYKLKGEAEARVAAEGWATGQAAREMLSSSVANALEKFMKNSTTINAANKRAIERLATETAKRQNVKEGRDTISFIADFSKRTDFLQEEKAKLREYEEAHLKDLASASYNIKGTTHEKAFSDHVHVYHDKNGDLKVSLLDAVSEASDKVALKNQAEISETLNAAIVDQTSRSGPVADARNGLMAQRILNTPAVNSEAHVAFYERLYLPPKIILDHDTEEDDQPLEYKKFGENS